MQNMDESIVGNRLICGHDGNWPKRFSDRENDNTIVHLWCLFWSEIMAQWCDRSISGFDREALSISHWGVDEEELIKHRKIGREKGNWHVPGLLSRGKPLGNNGSPFQNEMPSSTHENIFQTHTCTTIDHLAQNNGCDLHLAQWCHIYASERSALSQHLEQIIDTNINHCIVEGEEFSTYGNHCIREDFSLTACVLFSDFSQSSTRWPVVRYDHTMLRQWFHRLSMVLSPGLDRVDSRVQQFLPSFVLLPDRSRANEDVTDHEHGISTPIDPIHSSMMNGWLT